MAENCGTVCIKEEALKYMLVRIEKGETNTLDILKVVSDIKEGGMNTKYSLQTIENALKDSKERATLAATKLEAERAEAKKDKKEADIETLKEKRATRKAIYVAVAVVIVNTLIGLYLK